MIPNDPVLKTLSESLPETSERDGTTRALDLHYLRDIADALRLTTKSLKARRHGLEADICYTNILLASQALCPRYTHARNLPELGEKCYILACTDLVPGSLRVSLSLIDKDKDIEVLLSQTTIPTKKEPGTQLVPIEVPFVGGYNVSTNLDITNTLGQDSSFFFLSMRIAFNIRELVYNDPKLCHYLDCLLKSNISEQLTKEWPWSSRILLHDDRPFHRYP